MAFKEWASGCGRVRLFCGDCAEVLPTLSGVHACVTDPPYGLRFMGKRWDYDVPGVATWAAVLEAMLPGGHLLAFAGTRTQHRMAVRIEDAGFEIRDMLAWVYGSGFPKSHNGEWGGTALKPALEPITLARKPLCGTVAANVLAHGCGGLNVDGCRVGADGLRPKIESDRRLAHNTYAPGLGGSKAVGSTALGRWPANLMHDGSAEVVGLFPVTSAGHTPKARGAGGIGCDGHGGQDGVDEAWHAGGSAARFFYCAKASKRDRDEGCEGLPVVPCGTMEDDAYDIKTGSGNSRDTRRANHHPTVKPTDLMRYLCRLVTPPGGIVLDPFMGSGSTGKAALREGFRFVGIERDAESFEIARARIEHELGENPLGV